MHVLPHNMVKAGDDLLWWFYRTMCLARFNSLHTGEPGYTAFNSFLVLFFYADRPHVSRGPAPLTYSCAYFSIYSIPPASRAPRFPSLSNCEQHDNVVIICFSEKAHKCHLCTLIWCLRIYDLTEYLFIYLLPVEHQRDVTLVFKAFLHKSLPDCAVIVEYYMLPGGISMLLWATCAGWRRPSDSSCCLETGGGHAVLHQMLLRSFSPRLLRSSTLTSLLSVCQHFPRGGVRHGVRELGCQLTL